MSRKNGIDIRLTFEVNQSKIEGVDNEHQT